MGPKGPFTFLKWANDHGEVYKVQFMDNMAVVLTNADVIARITKKTGIGRPHACVSFASMLSMTACQHCCTPPSFIFFGLVWKMLRSSSSSSCS
jgi:hypothetical protein